jgi:hypothetical protein
MPNHSNHPPALQQASYVATVPSSYMAPDYYVSAGILGTVVGGSAALARNLHKVQDNEMTMKAAFVDSLAKGAGAGVATAAASAVVSSVRLGAFGSFALMVATATGVGYVLNSVGKSVSEKASGAAKKG